MKYIIESILSMTATAIVYIFGKIDVALECFLVTIVLDYITGILSAGYNKKLSSKTGLKGILKKLGLLCLIALSVIIDRITGTNGIVRTLIIYYLVANEGLSIIENLAEMNIIVPDFIKDKLEQIKKGGEGNGNSKR